MKDIFGRILEITFALIVAYLVLNNAFGLSQILRTSGQVYAESVKALQGRG